MRYWWGLFTKWAGSIFGMLGALAVLFPLTDISENNIFERSVILVSILTIVILISIISYVIYTKRKSKCVYNVGSTKIFFDYGDFNQIIKDEQNLFEKCTIVVPVNTSLEYVFDRDVIKENTVHRICLDYFYDKMQKSIDPQVLKNIEIKKGNIDFTKSKYGGKIGNWFLLTSGDLGLEETGKNFLFLEVFDIEETNGIKNNKTLSREKYLSAMQSLMDAIPQLLNHEDKIYIPLIGAGAGNVGKPRDIMHFMKSILRFNKKDLRQEIHVIVFYKQKKELPIYELTQF